MHKTIGIWFLLMLLAVPTPVSAGEWQLNFRFYHVPGSWFSSEMWYNNAMVWRLKIQTDGALPVSSSGDNAKGMVLIPALVNGMFVVKVHH